MRIHPRRILWPTDLSSLSLKGADYAQDFCETFGARLHVIHVAPDLIWDSSTAIMSGCALAVGTTDTVEPAKRALERLLSRHFGGAAREIRTHVVAGNAWQEICRYATEYKIDLIILTTHGATGLSHLLMGSTAERVVQHAICPVLTVKSFARQLVTPAKSATAPRTAARSRRARGSIVKPTRSTSAR